MNFKELKERFEHRLLDEKEIEFLFSKVEEMQKTLEWYADKENYGTAHLGKHGWIPIDEDDGERARQALKGVTHE